MTQRYPTDFVQADVDTEITPPCIRVHTRWHHKDLIKQVPGAHWVSKIDAWRLPLTWAAAVQLRGVFGETLQLSEELIKVVWEMRSDRVDPALELREDLGEDDNELDVPERQRHLFPFQRKAVQFMLVSQSGIDAGEMGTGKTVEACALLNERLERGDAALPALVICPNSAKRHWARHITERVCNATPYLIEGNQPQRRKLIKAAKEDPTAVVIINFEAVPLFSRLAPYASVNLRKCRECDKYGGIDDLPPAKCETHSKELNGFGFRSFILDEAHRIKDPHAKQTRAAWAIAHDDSIRWAWALTGTPIESSVADLWSILHVIAPAEHPVRTTFVNRYAIQGWNLYGGLEIGGLNPVTSNEFHRIIDPRFRRVRKASVLPQLPPKVYTTRYVDLTPNQKKMYDDLSTSLLTRTPEGELLVPYNDLVARTRLAQLAAATLKITDKPDPNDPRTWVVSLVEPSPKIDELLLVVDELGKQQAVVAADQSQLIDLACARLEKAGVPHLKITGDVANRDRDRALQALNGGYIKLLLFTSKAGGTALDMSAAGNLIFLQHPWSLIDYKQVEDRPHRIGAERHESINIISIMARNTIDDDKLERLSEKLRRLDEITRDRAEYERARKPVPDELNDEEMRLMATDLGVPS